MKAAIYPGEGKPITIQDIPDPQPGGNDVIIKVHRCGICGTDTSFTRGEMFDFGKDAQFGHEYAGEIIEIGKSVSNFSVGDRVAALPSIACGECAACSSHGNNVLCLASPGPGMVGFAEMAKLPTSVLTRLPSTLSMADGALVEPLAVSLYGLRQAQIRPGDSVLVLGGGTVALYSIYWARRLGAGRIVAMSRSERRKDPCLAMGANQFITYGDEEIPEVIEALGGSPDCVLECVGAEGMLSKAVMHVGQFGKIVSLGFCTSPDPVIPGVASFKCATMQFVVGYSMTEFNYIADQMDKGHVDPKTIISNDIALADLPDMMETLRGSNNETKVHVCME
ncbi:MAG: alcohol dehydrogenase catalytic domain-containing protein [Novosphingobium sp.]|nr:alcohol dehydrogenase catalytic domain-containing protein [Novosphingobium sp.]